MTCTPIKIGEATGFVCGHRKKTNPCHYCHHAGEFQCDHPVFRENVKMTCDTWLCLDCRNNIGENLDLCRSHFNFWRNNGRKFVLGGEMIDVK